MDWKLVEAGCSSAVAICNFVPTDSHCLELRLGDSLRVYEYCEGWHRGQSRRGKGVFPTSYVHIIKRCESGAGSSQCRGSLTMPEPSAIEEVGAVLREWWTITKDRFATRTEGRIPKSVQLTLGSMKELLNWRSQLISGNLPNQQVNELRLKIAQRIDAGNSELELDMVIRNDAGHMMVADNNHSIMEMYNEHVKAVGRMKSDARSSMQLKSRRATGVYSLLVDVQILAKVQADLELLFGLYDFNAREKEPTLFSEVFTASWPPMRTTSDGPRGSARVLFTDLGVKDLERDRVFLVCHVVRQGGHDAKDASAGRKQSAGLAQLGVRQAYAVAALDITDILSTDSAEDESQRFASLTQCGDECQDTVLRKMLSLYTGTAGRIDMSSAAAVVEGAKDQGLWVSLRLLHGDQKDVRSAHPHLFTIPTGCARKMGFPDVISPGDMRNDLYICCMQGEFRTGKTSDRNIEIKVAVLDEHGSPKKAVFINGVENKITDAYHSVVYHHQDRVRWMETIKLTIPVELVNNCHIRFTFRHRSSNEQKDQKERPFAIAFLRIIQDNGTILRDGQHDLYVYKVDKKCEDRETSYLTMLPTKADSDRLQYNGPIVRGTMHNDVFFLNNKDSFQVRSLTCSTKLTQNVELLGLLRHSSQHVNLKRSLESVMLADIERAGEEIVKFLQDILDALFQILVTNTDNEDLVFNCLVFTIGLVGEKRYHNFKPVMDDYLKNKFSATLAYNKLIGTLKKYTENVETRADDLLNALKSLEYLMRFVMQSRRLFDQLGSPGMGRDRFVEQMRHLFTGIAGLMVLPASSQQAKALLCQGAALRYFPRAIPHILEAFHPTELTNIVTQMINNVQPGRLKNEKMTTMIELVECPLFEDQACRSILLHCLLEQVRRMLLENDEVDLCAELLTKILIRVHRADVPPPMVTSIMHTLSATDDMAMVVTVLLRPLVHVTIAMLENIPADALPGTLSSLQHYVALLVAVLGQMAKSHYNNYLRSFATRTDRSDFLLELLMLMKNLITRNCYPKDWLQMTLFQNSVLLKTIYFLADSVSDYVPLFSDETEVDLAVQMWRTFFDTALAFITQPPLQLEQFSVAKRHLITERYKDMRRECALKVRSMWFSLPKPQAKLHFIPSLVGPFLQMILIPENVLRDSTIPIFFDMMTAEFYTHVNESDPALGLLPPTTPRSTAASPGRGRKGNFLDFEKELIKQLDHYFDIGLGDSQFLEKFDKIMSSMCIPSNLMYPEATRLVQTVTRLLRRLLEFRDVKLRFDNKENRMSCVVNLMEFYREIHQEELYVRYLQKLYELHMSCDDHIEAACVLQLHADLLEWSDKELSDSLRHMKHSECRRQRDLKERLYYDIIDLCDKGKLWEMSLRTCEELVGIYKRDSQFKRLSKLLTKMAGFYDNIIQQPRSQCSFFCVGFYGEGFPVFLRNKVFIYRGQAYERLADFTARMQNQFEHAELLNTLTEPDESVQQSGVQYLQVINVSALMADTKRRLSVEPRRLDPKIIWYHKHNEVQKFSYARKFTKRSSDDTVVDDSESSNEFAHMWLERVILVIRDPLPGILRWFPVVSVEKVEVSPLEVAIDQLEDANANLRRCIEDVEHDYLPVKQLGNSLHGIIDAAVMGGTMNYEKAFLSDSFLKRASPIELERTERLKDLIADQIPLLERGLYVHAMKLVMANASPTECQFHEYLTVTFDERKVRIEKLYGAKPSMLPPKASIHMPVMPALMLNPGAKQSRSNLNRHESMDNVQQSTPSPRRQSGAQSSSSTLFESGGSTPLRGVGISFRNPLAYAGLVSTTLTRPRGGGDSKRRSDKDKDREASMARRISNTSLSSGENVLNGPSSSSGGSGVVIELTQHLNPQRPPRPMSNSLQKRSLSQHSLTRDGVVQRSSSGIITPPHNNNNVYNYLGSKESLDDTLDMIDNNEATFGPVVPPPLPPKKQSAPGTPLATVSNGTPPSATASKKFSLPLRKAKPLPPVPTTESHC